MRRRYVYLSFLLVIAVAFPVWDASAAGLEDGLILYLTFEEEDPVDHSLEPADVSSKGAGGGD